MTFEPLVGNKAIEEAAVKYVKRLEIEAGPQPEDMRYSPEFPGDISSPPRIIEIKAVGQDQRGWFVPLEPRQYDAAVGDPNFYLYVVDKIRQGDPLQFRLKVFSGDRLARLLKGAKRREYWELPIPVAEFDDAPGPAALADV